MLRSLSIVRMFYLLALAVVSAGMVRLAFFQHQYDRIIVNKNNNHESSSASILSLLHEDRVVAHNLLLQRTTATTPFSDRTSSSHNVSSTQVGHRNDTRPDSEATPTAASPYDVVSLPPHLSSSLLPPWMTDYMAWHADQIQNLTPHNWDKDGRRYLVFRCLRNLDDRCGGASDRLQPVPFALMLANRTRRILFIDWTRPCRLEEFLVPPVVGGVNWTVPSFIQFPYRPTPAIQGTRQAQVAYDLNRIVVDIRHQSPDHGQSFYDANRDDLLNEPDFHQVYSRVWKLFFEPSPPVLHQLHQARQRLGLEPGRYVSLHVRSQYANDKTGNLDMVENALNCAVRLRKRRTDKIYLASDSTHVVQHALEYASSHPGMREAGVRVVVNAAATAMSNASDNSAASNASQAQEASSPPPPSQPLHLDRGRDFLVLANADWMNYPPSDYYGTFVDLYLLSGGACTAFNIGGYGRWSNLISANSTCRLNHHWHKCAAPPPTKINNGTDTAGASVAAAAAATTAVQKHGLHSLSQLDAASNDTLAAADLWDSSTVLPRWMKEYFAWHRDQLARLSPLHWNNATQFRYLIMRCLAVDDRCGGTSDRIQSVPYAILLANATRRILFITWEKPHPLEEFLVPPAGGMNWTVPDWLLSRLTLSATPESKIIRGSGTSYLAKHGDLVVQMRHQSHDHGAKYYENSQPPGAPRFEQVYREVWSVVFEPSPAVAALIERIRRQIGLGGTGGESSSYASVHVRANYQKQDANADARVRNAINCASALQPGATIYLATDSRNVTLAGLRYGKAVGGTVVARIHPESDNGDPLHLDRGSNFLSASGADLEGRPPSDFYDTFVDLYLLAGGQCTAVGVGGYGRWANAISPNSSCVVDHTRNKCDWTGAGADAVPTTETPMAIVPAM